LEGGHKEKAGCFCRAARCNFQGQQHSKEAKVAPQRANAGVVEANSIHRMSILMAKSTHLAMLTDHAATFAQGKECFRGAAVKNS
jgi:hypothetical protein